MLFPLVASLSHGAPGDVLASFPSPGCYPVGLAWDGTALWVSNLRTATCALPVNEDRFDRVDPATGAVLSGWATRYSHGLAWDGDLFALETWDDLVRWSAAGAVIDSWSDWFTGLPYGLAADPATGVLYVVDAEASEILVLDAATGAVLSTLPTGLPASGNADAAFDGCSLWVANLADQLLYQLDPATGAVLGTLPAPGPQPEGLEWDGAALWVGDTTLSTLDRVEIAPPGCLPPVEEEPVEEEPADEEPADEAPADEEPADEEPADDEVDGGTTTTPSEEEPPDAATVPPTGSDDDAPAEVEDPAPYATAGCGCSGAPGGPGLAWLPLVAWLGRRLRRSSDER